MKKILLKSFLLAIVFVLLRPQKANAQPCPMGILNSNTSVGLTNMDVYNTFSPGNYYVTFVHDNTFPCTSVFNQQMFVGKSANILGTLGTGGSGGMGIYFDLSPYFSCPGVELPGNHGLQNGSVSILMSTTDNGAPFLTLNYTNNVLDECNYTVVPVTFGPFTATKLSSPNRVRLDWTTYTEQDVDHFTIEKSSNGFVSYFKVAQVAAVGNSNAQNNYTWTDNNPVSDGYYRVVSVDLDCSREYTPIRRVTCTSGCPSTFTPPSIPADCTPPVTGPYISGPATICDNAAKLYRLYNVQGAATVTWSISPSYLATINQASRFVKVTPAGNGTGILTATVVKNGVTTIYNKTVTFGNPPFYVSGQTTPPNPYLCDQTCGTFTATIYPGADTYGWQYEWYQYGSYIGSGLDHTWAICPGQVIDYEVRFYGPCGTTIVFGSSSPILIEMKQVQKERFQIAPNPAKSNISIMKPPPCPIGPPPMEPLVAGKTLATVHPPVSETAIIKVFDTQGRLRKTTQMSGSSTRLTIDGSNLPAGLYFVQIAEPGKELVTLKVLLEK